MLIEKRPICSSNEWAEKITFRQLLGDFMVTYLHLRIAIPECRSREAKHTRCSRWVHSSNVMWLQYLDDDKKSLNSERSKWSVKSFVWQWKKGRMLYCCWGIMTLHMYINLHLVCLKRWDSRIAPTSSTTMLFCRLIYIKSGSPRYRTTIWVWLCCEMCSLWLSFNTVADAKKLVDIR